MQISGIDTSQMLGGAGQLAYWSHDNVVTPTDSTLPHSATLAGVMLATGTITTAGKCTVQCTTVGGKPRPGTMLWLAAGDDEVGAAGKASATRPHEGMWNVYGTSGPDWPRNAVAIGRCVDSTKWDSAKTCVVDLEPQALRNALPPDEQWITNTLDGISDSSYLHVPGNTTGVNMLAGWSWIITFTLDKNAAAGPRLVAGNLAAAASLGFSQLGGSACTFTTFGTGGNNLAFGANGRGVNRVAVSIDPEGLALYGVLGGEAFGNPHFKSAALTAINPGTVATTFQLGGNYAPAGAGFNWGDQGCIINACMLSGPLSVGEMRDLCDFTPRSGRNPYRLPEWLMSPDNATSWDPRMAWLWDAQYGVPNLSSYGPNAFTFVKAGSGLANSSRSKRVYYNLAPLLVDSAPTLVDQYGHPHASGGSRLLLPCSALGSQVIHVRFANDDWQGKNDDNAFIKYGAKNITSSTDATPIGLNIPNHRIANGNTAVIVGHLVNTNANGSHVITVVDANNITLNGTVGTGAGAGGATGTVVDVGSSISEVPVVEGGMINDNVDRWCPIAIDGGDVPSAQPIEVINGDPATASMHGGFVTAIACDLTTTQPTRPTVANRMILLSDGAAFAQDSGTTNRNLYGLLNLLRSTFQNSALGTGSVTFEGFAAGGLWNYTNVNTGSVNSIDWLVHRLLQIADEKNGNGTLPGNLILYSNQFAFNDYANPTSPLTAAAWGTLYRSLFDKFVAQKNPAQTVSVYIDNAWQLAFDATPNANSETPATFNTALTAAMAGSAYTVVNQRAGTAIAPYAGTGNIRASQAGLATWAGKMKAAAGW